MRRVLAVLLSLSCPAASAAPVRLAPAGQLWMPALPGFGINQTLATDGLAGLSAPGLPMSSLPSLDAGVLPLPDLTGFESAERALRRQARIVPQAPAIADGAPAISFFFNDHNASKSYRKELAAFVRANAEILVEMLKPGEETRIFQAVSDGLLTPADARKKLKERREPMDAAILNAIYRSGVKILPEPVHERRYQAVRKRIDGNLVPAAGDQLSAAYDAFLEDGDAEAAFESLKAFNATMAELHVLREKVLVESLLKRAGRAKPRPVGVLFGSFHTQPYHALRRAGVNAAREFHPKARGPLRTMPYNRPLRRLRFEKPYTDPDAEKRDTMGMILFFSLLDPLYRIDKFPGAQTALYHRIADQLSFSDYEDLSADMSEEVFDKHADACWFALDWLVKRGVIAPEERMMFRMSPAQRAALGAVGKKAFFRMAKIWKLTREEARAVLGVSTEERLASLESDPNAVLTEAELEHISYALGIYKALRTLISGDENARHWLRAPNKGLGGVSALSRMTAGGDGLAEVRSYLDAWAYGGGW